MANQVCHMWANLSPESIFFSKLRKASRLYRILSIQKAKEFRKEELDRRANLENALARLHEDVYNVFKQGEVREIKNALEGVESWKAKGDIFRVRMKWNKVGNKCSAEFFNSVKHKHRSVVITELQDSHGRSFTKREDLDEIVVTSMLNFIGTRILVWQQ